MEDLNKLCDDIDRMTEEVKLLTELALKYKDVDIVADKLWHKKIEDGIIKNFNNANLFQLEYMRNKYVFKYYEKEFVIRLIDAQILKNNRRDKMKKIENGF